jgi:CubicO group peptidase (beta-lactamase class C family)
MLLFMVIGSLDSAFAAPAVDPKLVVPRVDAYLDSLTRAGAFSGSVLLAQNGSAFFRKAYGLASRTPDVPNGVQTKFNLGSINKMFTKIAIGQLAQRGKLRLDDTIDRWLPDYPREAASRITVAHLLEHRGGVADFFGEKYRTMDHTKLRSVSDWIPLFRDEPLHFAPGSQEEYSNGGYLLLGAIVEKVSGQDYYSYVREHLYKPAGMKDTDSYSFDDHDSNRALGYTRHGDSDDSLRANTFSMPWRGSPAGGGYSTVEDLLRFTEALVGGKLLDDAWTSWALGAPAPGNGGTDPRRSPAGGTKTAELRREHAGMGIAGGAPGINAALELARGYEVIVLANLDPPAAEDVAQNIRGWLGIRPDGPGERRIIHAGGRHGPHESPRRTELPPGGVDVPMLRSGHLPAVDVMLNGQGPFRFAIDTGGAGSARVDSALAAKLGLRKIGEVMGGDPSGKNMRHMDLMAVDSIEVGGARFVGLQAAVRPYNEPQPPGEAVDGILGFGLFSNCLFTLDYPGNRVRIARGELPPENGKDILAYRDENGIPAVTLHVDSLDVEAHLDAGSMGGFTLPDPVIGKVALGSPPRVVGRARTVSNTFEIKASTLVGELRLGGFVYPQAQVEFGSPFPTANVGARVLRDYSMTFDLKNRRVQLVRSAASAGMGR